MGIHCFILNRSYGASLPGHKTRRPKMVLVFFLIITLDGVATLIGMLGTLVTIGFQLAGSLKNPGRRKKKSKGRRMRTN